MNLQELILSHQLECEAELLKCRPGPWNNEAHRVEFKHAGFDCLIKRGNWHLAWCGYVAVPKTHPYFGMDYRGIDDIEVHGGLSYSDKCEETICHTSDADEVWWLGFDCSHSFDVCPGINPPLGLMDYGHNVYMTQHKVMKETKHLAEQLKEVK